jgi:pyruvate-formate lyase-activating enzyme
MRLDEIMARRPLVGAGALVTLTQRCPLSCAHCSASATRDGQHVDADAFLRFLRTFRTDCRPDVLMLTGGEPLLRPRLVIEAAEAARTAGTRTAVLTGGFFAQGNGIPAPIRAVATAVDHFSLSLDAFHEREVCREYVFDVVRALLRLNVVTSLHVVGTDAYLSAVTADVTTRFGADVPMLVSKVQPVGRAASWLAARQADPARVVPCAMAAWPVICTDSAVTACCNQAAVDGWSRPDHLVLGDIATASWSEIVENAKNRALLRMIRTVGPLHIADRAGLPADDFCGTCQRLGDSPDAVAWAERAGGGAAGELLERAAAERVSLRQYGASLVGQAP